MEIFEVKIQGYHRLTRKVYEMTFLATARSAGDAVNHVHEAIDFSGMDIREESAKQKKNLCTHVKTRLAKIHQLSTGDDA